MPVEDRPGRQPHFEPSSNWQERFTAALDRLVGLLFTHQAIRERLRGREDDEYLAMHLDDSKQVLAEQVEETAMAAIDEFLAHLDHLQAAPGVPLYPPQPDSEGEQRGPAGTFAQKVTVRMGIKGK